MALSEHVSSVRFLLVDDDETFVERFARALATRGFEVQAVSDARRVAEVAQGYRPQRVVLDLRMPGCSGLEVLEQLLAIDPEVQVLMLTGYGSIATAVDALRLGAVGYLQKPVDVDGVLAAFDRAEAPPLAPTDPNYTTPSLARVEWDHIQRVMSDCGGNVTKAARVLGMHRRTLQRKLSTNPPRR